jgi:hypothetical protein
MKRKANLYRVGSLVWGEKRPTSKSSALWSLRSFVSHRYAPGLSHVPALASS